MRHLDEGTIHAWLDGALSADEERKAESHAAQCTQCASAVADARGFIAASSRILSALDNVPAGVIPQDYRAMPAAQPASRAPRIPAWTLRVAASVVVVAAGTLIVVDRYGSSPRASTLEQLKAKDAEAPTAAPANAPAPVTVERSESSAVQAPATPSAGRPATNELAAGALSDKLEADAKQKVEDPQRAANVRDSGASAASGAAGANVAVPEAAERTLASKPEMKTAPAPAAVSGALSAPASAAPAPGLAADQMQLTPKAPSVQSAQSSVATTAKHAAPMPFPGMRLVSEQMVTEDAVLVQKRVFEVRPGIQVTLASFASAPAQPAEARSDADSATRDSVGRMARRQFRMKSLDEPVAGINSIQWTDSTGTEFMLSGPLPLDSLRALRPYLPVRPQRP